jgi:hypothetical protein
MVQSAYKAKHHWDFFVVSVHNNLEVPKIKYDFFSSYVDLEQKLQFLNDRLNS